MERIAQKVASRRQRSWGHLRIPISNLPISLTPSSLPTDDLTSYFTEKIKVIPRKLPQILTSSSTQLWTLALTCSLFPPITLDKVIHAST